MSDTLIVDGLTVDAETGEVLSHREFVVDSLESAEWALGRIQDAELALRAVQDRRRAILENLDAMETPLRNRVDGLRRRFEGDLTEWARNNLPIGKRSVRTPYGEIAFRTVPAARRVTDPDLALQWAESNCPESIVTKLAFQISKVPKDLAAPEGSGIETVPAREVATVKTGVSL